MSDWVGPTTTTATSGKHKDAPMYRALVVDSGPIIKNTQMKLFGKAEKYYTTPSVMAEIRDSKARSNLQQWPMELIVKECSPESLQRIATFSKQTGDYASLSKVDLQVLALVLDLEQEGCCGLEHVRTTPKRTIGLGTLQALNKKQNPLEGASKEGSSGVLLEEQNYDIVEEEDNGEEDEQEEQSTPAQVAWPKPTQSSGPKSWAMMVNSSPALVTASNIIAPAVVQSSKITDTAAEDGHQFDDAEEDEQNNTEDLLQANLESDFPSFAVAATVPYDDSDDKAPEPEPEKTKEDIFKFKDEQKKQALQVVSKSGKQYNSFKKYSKLMKPSPATEPKKLTTPAPSVLIIAKDEPKNNPGQSRILGTTAASGGESMKMEEDDGEGWITCKSDIQSAKALGRLDPIKNNNNNQNTQAKKDNGPPLDQRTACTTTDFAMQNVLLQMGMLLLSVEGMQIKKVKHWVMRCGACFKIHSDQEFTAGNATTRRMFCSHCGSGDMMQRIACSVDGKTGRLKLHLKKNYKHNLRGTKFSLPKAGSVSIKCTDNVMRIITEISYSVKNYHFLIVGQPVPRRFVATRRSIDDGGLEPKGQGPSGSQKPHPRTKYVRKGYCFQRGMPCRVGYRSQSRIWKTEP